MSDTTPPKRPASRRTKRLFTELNEAPDSVNKALAHAIRVSTDGTQQMLREPLELYEYRLLARSLGDKYAQLSFLWRLRVADIPTLLSQGICASVFVVWASLLPPAPTMKLSFVSQALAASASGAPFDPKPVIHLGVFAVLFATFIISIWVNYFGKSEKAAESAGTVSKTLLGFFVGIGTNYIGVSGG